MASCRTDKTNLLKLAHEMKPAEIQAIASKGSCAFVPISPTFEWYSFHLPVGTDAIIAQTFAEQLALEVKGLCFSALSLGLDRYRTPEEDKMKRLKLFANSAAPLLVRPHI